MNVHYECGHVEFDLSTQTNYIERYCDFCLEKDHAEYYENIDALPNGDPVVLTADSDHPGPDCGYVDYDGPYQPAPGRNEPPEPITRRNWRI